MRGNRLLAILMGVAGCSDGTGVPVLIPGPAEIELASRSAEWENPCAAEVDLDLDGAIDATWEYEYSDGGRHERDLERTLEGTLMADYGFDYDNGGRFIGWDMLDVYDDGTSYRSILRYQYDAHGRRLGTSSDGDGDGSFETVVTMTAWNEAGLWTAATSVSPSETYFSVASYDAHGRLTEVERRFGDGSLRGRTTYVYDDLARTRTAVRLDLAYRSHNVYRYNADGYLVGYVFTSLDDQGMEQGTTTGEYTLEGNRLTEWSEIYSFGGGSRTTYQYCD